MLGLADEVGDDERRRCAPVRDDEDLGRARLGVDADDALHGSLGRRHVEVSGARDDLHRLEADLGDPVGERCDRASAAHRVDLVHTQQSGGGEDRRVHGTAEGGLRRRGERDRGHARDLRGHDVHHDARGVDGLAAGHVESHAIDGLPALHDASTRGDLGDALLGHLRRRRGAHPLDRDLERLPHARVERLEGARERCGGHAHRGRSHAVEALRLREQSILTPLAHLRDDRRDSVDGGADVTRRARHEGQQLGGRELPAAQIKSRHHGAIMLSGAEPGIPPSRRG